MIKNISRLTFIGGCILLLAGLMSDCSLPSKKIEQVYSFKEKVSLSNEQISHFEKMHNGVSFSEALNPFGPDGLEKHLYEGGFDKFYSQLQTEINKFQNNKLDRHKTKLRFWGGDVILFDSNDLMSFFIVNPEPRSIELNVHYLGSKVDLKNTLRVALINEAVNLLFFNEFPLSRERFIQEEMLSDLAMCMCPDSSNEKWMELVAGRLMPIVETPQFKQLDDITLIDRTGLNVPGYVKVIRIYANELIKSLQQSAEEITKKQGTITFLILQKYPNDEESFQKDMISFWKSELTPMKFQKFKSGCQNRYQEELRKYW